MAEGWGGRCNGGPAQIKNGAHSGLLQSGLPPAQASPRRRNSDKDDVRGGKHRHHTSPRGLQGEDLRLNAQVEPPAMSQGPHSGQRQPAGRMCCANGTNLSLAKYCDSVSTCDCASVSQMLNQQCSGPDLDSNPGVLLPSTFFCRCHV